MNMPFRINESSSSRIQTEITQLALLVGKKEQEQEQEQEQEEKVRI